MYTVLQALLLKICSLVFCLASICANVHVQRVEPRLVDTPEIQTSTVMRTLHAVPDISYVDK